MPALLAGFQYRVRQAAAFVRHDPPPALPAEVARLLDTPTTERFRELPVADQRHAIAVCQAVLRAGARDKVAIAALLHDIGKGAGHHHVNLLDRSAKVVLERALPALIGHIRTTPHMPRVGAGLWIAANHPRLGAEIARDLGHSSRVVWLIGHHEDLHPQDEELKLLQAADSSPDTIAARAIGRPAGGSAWR